MTTRLVDERGFPPVRRMIGELLEGCARADLAIGRIRLGVLDLTDAEVRGPERCRVLLGRLDAATLLDAAPSGASPRSRDSILRLRQWLDSGRLEVRSAGLGSWTPDFSVYRTRGGTPTCLLGAHYFGSPHLTLGPSFTICTVEASASSVLLARFDGLWDDAHDVGPAIADVLDRASAGGHPAG